MKKKIHQLTSTISFLFSILYLLFTISLPFPVSYAQTSTPTKSPSPKAQSTLTPTATDTPKSTTVPKDSEELEKIQKIKDIVASKVAELDLVEKRGIIGKVVENKNMSLVVEDVKGNSRSIDVDELTEFSIGDDNDKDLGVSDLKKGTLYSFVGLYNKDTERLLARTISETDSIPVFIDGVISGIDEVEKQIQITNTKGEVKTIDIQTSTKTSLSNADGAIEKSGFSKLELNQRVLAAGFVDTKDDKLIVARRIMHFESLPPSKEMKDNTTKASSTTETTDEGN